MAVEVFYNTHEHTWQVGMLDSNGAFCWLRDEHGNIADVTLPGMPRTFHRPTGDQLFQHYQRVVAKFREMA